MLFRVFFFQEYVSKVITHLVFYSNLIFKLSRVKGAANFITSGLKIVKRLWRRQYDQVIIEKTTGLVFGPFTVMAYLFWSVALWLTRRWEYMTSLVLTSSKAIWSWSFPLWLLVPYRWNRGDYRFLRRLSVSLSLRPSVSPLDVRPLGFPNFSQSSSSEATGSWSSSPLIVSRDSFSHQTWARFQPGGA